MELLQDSFEAGRATAATLTAINWLAWNRSCVSHSVISPYDTLHVLPACRRNLCEREKFCFLNF